MNLMKWKEKYLFVITKLCLKHLDEYTFLDIACWETNFYSYRAENNQSIFYGNLPNLIKFNVKDCLIVICREALNVADQIFPVTNIKELSLENIYW